MVGHVGRKGMRRINQQIDVRFPHLVDSPRRPARSANAQSASRCRRLADASGQRGDHLAPRQGSGTRSQLRRVPIASIHPLGLYHCPRARVNGRPARALHGCYMGVLP